MTPRRALACVQYLLLVFGFSALGYCAIVLFEAACYQASAREHLSQGDVGVIGASTTRGFRTTSQPSLLRSGSDPTLFGRIEIPIVHISVTVAEGTSPRVLRLAVGHMPGTALPGDTGNVVVCRAPRYFFSGFGRTQIRGCHPPCGSREAVRLQRQVCRHCGRLRDVGFGTLPWSVATADHLLSLLLRWSCSETICYPCPQNRHRVTCEGRSLSMPCVVVFLRRITLMRCMLRIDSGSRKSCGRLPIR